VFASSVTLGRFGRPFLQPLYNLAAGKVLPDEPHFGVKQDYLYTGSSGLSKRLRHALEWWVEILEMFPGKEFAWGQQRAREVHDVFTDASAEAEWEGLGGVVFTRVMEGALSYRVTKVPPEVEPFLPSKAEQKVRIAQLELLAVLIFVKLFGSRFENSFIRFHIDNMSALFCALNAYSSNPYMARLSGELWMLLLQHNIVPWFQYVPSKLNVADIFSRPDRVIIGRRFGARHRWRSVSPTRVFRPLAHHLRARPQVAWGELYSRLYDGRRR